MTRILTTAILIACIATSDVFAQRNRPQQQQQTPRQITSATMLEEDGRLFVRLPQRNDAAGIAARNALDAAQRLINPPTPEFSFMQPTEEDRGAKFQQAIDTLQSLLVFINPPEVEEPETSPETLTYYGEQEEQPEPQPTFVPDAFVNAHYLIGMGWIYLDKMNQFDLFTPEELASFPQKAADYFEAFIENGVAGNSAFIYSILANLYSWQLNDPRRALINIDRSIALEPREPSHHVARAQLLHGQGYLEAACASLRRARELGDDMMAESMMQTWGCP